MNERNRQLATTNKLGKKMVDMAMIGLSRHAKARPKGPWSPEHRDDHSPQRLLAKVHAHEADHHDPADKLHRMFHEATHRDDHHETLGHVVAQNEVLGHHIIVEELI